MLAEQAPLWDQLEPAAKDREFELETEPARSGRASTLRRSRRGEARDFDEVVLAIPVGALEPICKELIEHDERFAAGIRKPR